VINVNNKSSRAAFDEHDLSVLVALVERVGSAVERAYAYPDSGRAVNDAVAAVRSVTHLHAEGLLGTRHHVRHARLLARELGLPDHEVDLVGYCATIHDVGMGPLQRRVWSVPGPLAEDDRRALESHPEASLEILRPLEYLSAVRDTVLAHHERWDGAGYPRALAGTRIPIGARILAVVDAYESMTAGRPWRAARTHEQALAELRGMSGAQFDPDVIEAFERVIERERGER
jgi:HD-GYP domain-containing protein (c-di-GMP phosphodiesterase class II)